MADRDRDGGFFHGWSKKEIEKGLEAMMRCEKMTKEQSLPDAIRGAQLLDDDSTTSLKLETKECLKSMQSTKYELFNDPVHGSIELHPLLAEIVNMRAFTRLKNIRQLGGVYYVYPGATHTRFEHSIGTCYIAGEFIRMLRRKQPELHITDKEAMCVEIAALCHDLGHGPFSHLFEKEVVKHIVEDINEALLKEDKPTCTFPKHEHLSASVFEHHIYKPRKELFDWHGIGDKEVRFIKELIDHNFSDGNTLKYPERRFLYEIVANKVTGIDVDKWDYFARDCHYMGILTEFDWRRLMALSRVIRDPEEGFYRMCYRDKEVNNIYGMFRTRCSLHQKAYQHKAVIAAEHMIAEAIVKMKDVQLIKPWSSESTPSPTTKTVADVIKEVAKDSSNLEGYLALNDGIIHQILQCGSAADSDAQSLLECLDKRNMFSWIASEPKGTVYVTKEDILAEKEKGSNEFTVDDVYVRTVEISYGSEKNERGEKDDPIKATYFYTKKEPWTAIKGTDKMIKKSELVTPVKFTFEENRIYSSPQKKKEVKRAYDAAKCKTAGEANKECTRKTNEETPTSRTKEESGCRRRLDYLDNDSEDNPSPAKKTKTQEKH